SSVVAESPAGERLDRRVLGASVVGVTDDGCGYDAASVRPGVGYGIMSSAERARRCPARCPSTASRVGEARYGCVGDRRPGVVNPGGGLSCITVREGRCA